MRPHTLVLAVALAGVSLAASAPSSLAQEPSCYLARGTMEAAAERPSPLGETVFTMGDQTAKVCYGRPSARGRPVAGNLIPFGEVWRMGANEATALHLPFPATVGGIELEAGSYSLYTIAGEAEWEIFVNATVERWGIPVNEEIEGANVGSFTLAAEAIDEMVEQLTFRWHGHGDDMGHLVVEWENTRVEIPIQKTGS